MLHNYCSIHMGYVCCSCNGNRGEKMTEKKRRYLPSLSDLIDRMSIDQLKEVRIPEHKAAYAQEIKDIMYDIDLFLDEIPVALNADIIRNIIILAHYNNHIWYNESEARKGNKDGSKLLLSHSLNGVRNRAKNNIEYQVKGRIDHKVDCLASEYSDWEPSWNSEE